MVKGSDNLRSDWYVLCLFFSQKAFRIDRKRLIKSLLYGKAVGGLQSLF